MFNNVLQIPANMQVWYLALFVWSIVWKAMALWRASHKEQKWWFAAFLVINTAGILEILYIYIFSVDRRISGKTE